MTLQIAKADGDTPVQAYIAAMPGWRRDIGKRLDALFVRNVHNILFSSHPDGAAFRAMGIDDHPKSEWPQFEQAMLKDIGAYLGLEPSVNNNSRLDSATEDATGFMFVGRFSGMHTEIHIRNADGKADQLLVEVD
jgi:hypothetical protein